MIDAKRNRLDYGKQLAPPLGFELDHAVGTTFSLDLEAILLIPVALFFSEDLDINPKEIRDDTLESLVNVSKKVSIYHQRGKIKVPEQYSQLMAYWEKGLCPVHLDSYSRSFHPKIWIIRYTEIKGKNIIYRIINTSRNLTFSRDWDLAITTEGQVNIGIQGKNKPLTDFLCFLDGFKNIPKEYFKELTHVQFDVLKGFDELLFHPIGIKNEKGVIYKNPITADRYKKDFKLIMSPFLDDSTIRLMSESSNETVLFSSDYELSKLSPEVLERVTRKFMFSPFIEDAENLMEISESGVIPMFQNLHAKYYITQRGGKRSWFVGSANATDPAHERNIELLMELKGGKYNLRPQLIEEELTRLNSDGISLFEKFHERTTEQIEEDHIWQQHLRRLIYEISSVRFSADVLINQKETFDLSIEIPKIFIDIPDGVEIKIKPLPEQSLTSAPISFSAKTTISKFTNYQEIDLSPFLVVELWRNNEIEKKFIVDMVIDLERFSNRMNKIFSNIISSRSKFLNYLSFLLSDTSPTVIDNQTDKKKAFGSTSNYNGIAFFEGTPIYEKLLVAASRDPKKLKKINSLIERIKDQTGKDDKPLVSDQFEEMWEIFKPFSK